MFYLILLIISFIGGMKVQKRFAPKFSFKDNHLSMDYKDANKFVQTTQIFQNMTTLVWLFFAMVSLISVVLGYKIGWYFGKKSEIKRQQKVIKNVQQTSNEKRV